MTVAAVTITGWIEWLMLAVTFVGALGAAVAVINRWVVAPLERRRDEERRERVAETEAIVADATGPINDKLDQIVREVSYNGGASLKDAVRRIDDRVTRMEGRLDERDRWAHGLTSEPGEGRL